MLLQKKSNKRQSFSIESLAISSHAEQDRDTDSPYLSYLESKNSPTTLDYNSNNVSRQWSYSAGENGPYNNIGFSVQENISKEIQHYSGTHFVSTPASCMPNHSTPKMPSPKRRRLDSTCTPPSSDDSATDDKMLIDNNSVLMVNSPDGEKLSPASTTVSSAASGTVKYLFIFNSLYHNIFMPRGPNPKATKTKFMKPTFPVSVIK